MKNLFNHILPDSALSTFDGDTREENEGSEEEFEELLYFEDLLNQVVSERERIKRSAVSGKRRK